MLERRCVWSVLGASLSNVVLILVSWVFMLFIMQHSPFETEERVNLLEEIGASIRIHPMLCLFSMAVTRFPEHSHVPE
jgi:hypothetical protein